MLLDVDAPVSVFVDKTERGRGGVSDLGERGPNAGRDRIEAGQERHTECLFSCRGLAVVASMARYRSISRLHPLRPEDIAAHRTART